jgi:sulfonate transport system substrate-binding protein
MNRAQFLRASVALFATLASGGAAVAQSGKPAESRTLRIAFQKGSVSLAVLKQRGALEARLPGVAITWLEFPAGPQLLEALALDSADFGAVGDSPPVFAQAAGKDLVYVGAEPPKPDSSAILVRQGSPITKLADLKGKRIAFQRGSSAHYLTVRALEKAGIAYKEFEPIHLPPAEARAAFDRGSVDAWAIWDPYYAAAELQGGARVLATGRDLVSNNSYYLASKNFVARNPELLLAALDELTKNDFFLRDKRKEAISLYSSFSGLDAGVVARLLERRPASKIGPLTQAIIDDQQRVADTYFRLGLIPKSVQVSDIVWRPDSARLAKSR